MTDLNSSNTQAQPLEVSGLCVVARSSSAEEKKIVDDVGFSLKSGEVLALIGETGSGKSTIALALMGYARSGCRIAGGRIMLGGTSVLDLSPSELRYIRGNRISYIAQSAAAAFNPSKTLMAQVIEGVVIHGLMSRKKAREKARLLFAELALPDPEHIGDRYPHEVSGGQLQRAMAAMALISDPALIILDEPTTALDVTTQIEVLQAFKRVVREYGTTAVYVSHDLAIVAQVADQVLVLNDGCTRESGKITQILDAPANEYTQRLIGAAGLKQAQKNIPASKERTELLSIKNLSVGYGGRKPHDVPEHTVLDDISLRLDAGKALGIIGESGSGKSTLAHTIAGLVPAFRGTMSFQGQKLPFELEKRTKQQFRDIQLVFQSADNALNVSHTVRHILGRPIYRYFGCSKSECDRRVRRLLDLVRLPSHVLGYRPGMLSGGQKQRVNLARALAAEPSLVICDEVTSALDTIVGEAVLDLLADLRRELGLAYLFISHDISTVREICDEVLVLYHGQNVEYGVCEEVIDTPRHSYTRLLIDSIPQLRTDWLDEKTGPSSSF